MTTVLRINLINFASDAGLLRAWFFQAGLSLLWLGTPEPTSAFSIDQVTVWPGTRVVSTDAVNLQVEITTPNSPAFLYQPTRVTISGTRIQVDIFPADGVLYMLGSLTTTVPLGVLPAGQYDYEVRLNPMRQVGWGTRVTNGIFFVDFSRRPDLYESGVSIRFSPARLEPGANLHVRWLVANNGTIGIPEDPPPVEVYGPAEGPWEEAVFLSGNGTSILLGRRAFNGILNPHEGHEFDEAFPIPATLRPGFYDIVVCSDYLEGQPAGRVPETNEANNSSRSEFTVKIVQDVTTEPVLAFESQRRLGSNRRSLVLRGEAGRSFRLQVSSDLANWSTVATVVNPDGIVRCLDYPAGAPQRFYRAELVP